MIGLATIEIIIGIIVFFASLYSFHWGGKGNGFKIYAACILAFNLLIALNR